MNIPVNLLHRHDLIGLPNILTREMRTKVTLHPLSQKPYLSLPLAGVRGWNTFIQGTNYHVLLLPLQHVGEQVYLSLLEAIQFHKQLVWNVGDWVTQPAFSDSCWLVSQPVWSFWLGLIWFKALGWNLPHWPTADFKKRKTMVNMEESLHYTSVIRDMCQHYAHLEDKI